MTTTEADIVRVFDAAPGVGTIKNVDGHDILVVRDGGTVLYAGIHDRAQDDGHAVVFVHGEMNVNRIDLLAQALRDKLAG